MNETRHTPFVRWRFDPVDHGYWILELLIRPKETVTLLTTSEEYGCLAETTRNKIATSFNARPKLEELLEIVRQYTEHAAKPPWESKPFDHDAWLMRAEKAIREVEAALKETVL